MKNFMKKEFKRKLKKRDQVKILFINSNQYLIKHLLFNLLKIILVMKRRNLNVAMLQYISYKVIVVFYQYLKILMFHPTRS